MTSTAIIGVGNILFQDEGIGCYAGRYLEANYTFSEEIDIIDGGTLGFKLMTYYQTYERVIIIDTVSIEDAPGSIYNLPADVLMGLGSYRQTAHEVEVVEMLEICSLLERMAEVSVIGMIPEDIVSVNIDLTQSIKAAFPALIAEVIRELERCGIACQPKSVTTGLDQIIKAYNNPSQAKLCA
ncbi:MAG: HyaD/HybD family hydrogenase maturation endopeptidase [Campylobacterales bacterium]|nr:HyaD/HybD family hydrogenase maturation endopeptidase [Campylobacterales bacterium]